MIKSQDKIKKPMFDESNGFNFMAGWPPIARWVSIVPAVLVAFFVFRLAFGTLAMLLQKVLPDLISSYLIAFIPFFIYFALTYAGAAAAPIAGRKAVAIGLALLFSVGLVAVSVIGWPQVEGHDAVILTISTLLSLLGCVTAITYFSKTQKLDPTP
ncbi:hypothetical protein HKK55_22790 [Pseudomonas sp. ADAK18]|uniref:hypothetical protein n=1 Tax=Pseudomonas sp. ADAK18 TaxID=2730848 RepID=UPI001463267F|nr:hypothetical protein [Pseudomonas sp. ADAK18]QJI31400.1 hypothetical protein HKK55_22790 [Pseudomonas sp. ADAK18]